MVFIHLKQLVRKINNSYIFAIGLLIIVLLISITLPIIIAQRSRDIEGFTEFYLLDTLGKTSNIPNEILEDEFVKLTMVIANHEGVPVDYSVNVKNGDLIFYSEPFFSISDSEEWIKPIEFAVPISGDRQMIEFILNRKGYSSPYRNLHIYLDIKPKDIK